MLPTFDVIQAAQHQGRTADEVLRDPAYDLDINRDREGLDLAWAVVADDRRGFKRALRALGTSPRLKVECTPTIELSSALGYAYHPSRVAYARPLIQAMRKTKNGLALLREDLIRAVRQGDERLFALLLPSVGSDRPELNNAMKALLAGPETWTKKEAQTRLSMLQPLMLPMWSRWVRGLPLEHQGEALSPLFQASAQHPALMEEALWTFTEKVSLPHAACLLALASDEGTFEKYRRQLTRCLENIFPDEVNDCRRALAFQWCRTDRQPRLKEMLDLLQSSRGAAQTPVPEHLAQYARDQGCPLEEDQPDRSSRRWRLGGRRG